MNQFNRSISRSTDHYIINLTPPPIQQHIDIFYQQPTNPSMSLSITQSINQSTSPSTSYSIDQEANQDHTTPHHTTLIWYDSYRSLFFVLPATGWWCAGAWSTGRLQLGQTERWPLPPVEIGLLRDTRSTESGVLAELWGL